MLIKLAIKSLIDRKGSVILSIISMAISIFVLLGVEHIRHQTKQSFSNTVSGIDLIVGAKTSQLNLLLYSVFRIGSPTNNISWKSFEKIRSDKNVQWAIPLSLGDSHKGYRVLGTSTEYFKYFSYNKKQHLEFQQGAPFSQVFEVVLGAEVARKLNYSLGSELILAHGIAETSFSLHDNHPFKVVGILEPTGTPVDQTLHVSLQAIEAIHIGWQQGVQLPTQNNQHDNEKLAKLQPKSITAFMVGLKSKMSSFRVQRYINNYKNEPLLAILPGVALSELWQMMGVLEKTLVLISVLLIIAVSLGISAMLLSSIRERNRELQLLRMIGASPSKIFVLIQLEALFITASSIILGGTLLLTVIGLSKGFLLSRFGLHITQEVFTQSSLYILLSILAVSFVAALIPSIYAFIKSSRKSR